MDSEQDAASVAPSFLLFTTIGSPSDTYLPRIAKTAINFYRKKENFICISLNGAHEVIATRVVTVGLANLCQVHPREVLADPNVDRACAVLIAHNHPSGNLEPSEADLLLTTRIEDAAKVLGTTLLDFVESTGFATTVRLGQTQAGTIEHLMSALCEYGIANVLVKCNGGSRHA